MKRLFFSGYTEGKKDHMMTTQTKNFERLKVQLIRFLIQFVGQHNNFYKQSFLVHLQFDLWRFNQQREIWDTNRELNSLKPTLTSGLALTQG